MNPQLGRRTVFMTGELSTEMIQIVGQEYAGVLQKPFKSDELMSAVQKALRMGSPSGSTL
jgi:DNA-binding response OmpR family regulator